MMNHSPRYLYAFVIFFIFLSCGSPQSSEKLNNTTPTASELASLTMETMGGEEAWHNTRYLYWDFFGNRCLLWDKWTGNVRIDSYADSTTYLVNINTLNGKSMVRGKLVTNPDSVDFYVIEPIAYGLMIHIG